MDHIPDCQGNSPGLHPAFDHPRISCSGKGMSYRPNPYSDGSCLFYSVLTFFPCQRPEWSRKSFAICAVSMSLLKTFCKCSVLYMVCDMIGEKLRYIILISITGTCSRKVDSFLLHWSCVHNKGSYLHRTLEVGRVWGSHTLTLVG